MPCVTMTSSRGVGYSILGGGLSLATEGVGQGRDGARVFRVRGGGASAVKVAHVLLVGQLR